MDQEKEGLPMRQVVNTVDGRIVSVVNIPEYTGPTFVQYTGKNSNKRHKHWGIVQEHLLPYVAIRRPSYHSKYATIELDLLTANAHLSRKGIEQLQNLVRATSVLKLHELGGSLFRGAFAVVGRSGADWKLRYETALEIADEVFQIAVANQEESQ